MRPPLGRRDPRRARALLSVAVAGCLGAACSQNTVVLPSRDFDRPTDMAFACLGVFQDQADQKVSLFPQPMGKCHPSGIQDQKPDSVTDLTVGDRTFSVQYRTYAFVPNSERGDLSVVNMAYCRPGDTRCWPPGAAMVDLDLDSAGFGAAPLGVLPEVIAASQDGCRLVTANRGSCDLSFIDPAILLSRTIVPKDQQLNLAPLNSFAQPIVPRTSSGRLALAPGDIAFVPQQTGNPAADDRGLCPSPAAATLAAPAGAPAANVDAPATWRAVVTFPSCDLIALLDLPSGNVLDSYQLKTYFVTDAANQTTTTYRIERSGPDPVCPVVDCPRLGSAPAVDAGGADTLQDADDGGGAAATDDAGGAVAVADANADADQDGDVGGVDGDQRDAGSDDGAVVLVPVVSNLGVNTLAIHPGGSRVYFGATNAPVVAALDIAGAADTFVAPVAGSTTMLHAGAGGITRLRLSVDPFAYAKNLDPTQPEYGRFVAGRHDDQPDDPLEFLYVLAKDSSLRVVNVALKLRPTPFECDLAVDPNDPRALAIDVDGNDATRRSCFAYHDPGDPNDVPGPDDPKRVLFAGSPGLRIGAPLQDVAFANYRTPPRLDPIDPIDNSNELTLAPLDEQTLSGAFAFLMTGAGLIYVVNIDPELRRTAQVLPDVNGQPTARAYPESPRPLTHSLRDANVVTFSPALGPQNGPPRLDAAPIGPTDAPRLMAFLDAMSPNSRINALIVPQRPFGPLPATLPTYVYFPNRTNVTAQTWTITWEGDLTGVRITGDIVDDPGIPAASPRTKITDNGTGFCGLGALDGDVMTLVGCEMDSSCQPGTVCVRSSRVPATVEGRSVTGLCLPQSQAGSLRDGACAPLLETFRRYDIFRPLPPDSADAAAIVVPKRAEVHRVAHADADGNQVACSADIDCQPPTTSVTTKFECVRVTARTDGRPLAGDPLLAFELRQRCLQRCTTDVECGQGRVCVSYEADGRFCADGPPIAPLASVCGLDQLISYKISAGGAFVVSGGASGRLEQTRTSPGPMGPTCVTDTSIPLFVARIPLNTPLCDDASKPPVDGLGFPMLETDGAWRTTFLATADPPQPNPCFVVDTHFAPQQPAVVSAVFQNTQLRFVMTDLQKPIADSFQIRFDVHGGTSPQIVIPSVDATPGLPSRILLGPIPSPEQTLPGDPVNKLSATAKPGASPEPGVFSDLPYLFVVDRHQFSAGRVGVRGQILRITPRISESTAPLAGFESFTTSGRYFPIQ